jgi:hypothetical protein
MPAAKTIKAIIARPKLFQIIIEIHNMAAGFGRENSPGIRPATFACRSFWKPGQRVERNFNIRLPEYGLNPNLHSSYAVCL